MTHCRCLVVAKELHFNSRAHSYIFSSLCYVFVHVCMCAYMYDRCTCVPLYYIGNETLQPYH